MRQGTMQQVQRTNGIVPHRHDFEKGFFAKQAMNDEGLSVHLAQTGWCDTHGHGLVTCPGKSGPPVVRISTWHLGEGHAKEEDLTREDHFAAAAD